MINFLLVVHKLHMSVKNSDPFAVECFRLCLAFYINFLVQSVVRYSKEQTVYYQEVRILCFGMVFIVYLLLLLFSLTIFVAVKHLVLKINFLCICKRLLCNVCQLVSY